MSNKSNEKGYPIMKKALLTLLVLCCLTLSVQAADFSDLPKSHWAYTAVQQATEAGVISGYSDGTFRPAGPVTASHFCAFLSRSFLAEELAEQTGDEYRYLNTCLPVLQGTGVLSAYEANGERWGGFADQRLTRFDMAQIIYNLVTQELGPQDEDEQAVQGELTDWLLIPKSYRPAVTVCCCLGVLQGQSSGSFGGEKGLNRAQAAVIWSRLNTLFEEAANAPKEEEIPGKEMPAFGLQEDETAQQMMDRVNARTPRCEEGCLPNGKPRTDENVAELLALVEQGCPNGTVWSSTIRYNYLAPSAGATKGCLSFGMAVSDFLFGEESPVTHHQNFRSLKVGDVIHAKSSKASGAQQVQIVTAVDHDKGTYTACELQENGKVHWLALGTISGLIDRQGTTTVYSRG